MGERLLVGLAGAITRATAFDAGGKAVGDLPIQARDGKNWFEIPAEAARVAARQDR